MVQQNPKTEQKRTRVLLKRQSRNGCYTCKERKIRCDETRPGCTKCTRSGRSCGGYSTWRHQDAYLDKGTSTVPMTTLSRALPQPGVQARGEGVNFFDLGRDFLLREMQGFFETTHQFWKRLLPQVVHIDLSAHAACVVLGTAVNSRRRETDERYSTQLNIACMCFLLVMTDLLLDRHVQALFHLQGALGLLQSRQQNMGRDNTINLKEASNFALLDVIDIAAVSLDISVSSYASELPPRLPSLKAFDDFPYPGLKGQELQALKTLHSAYEFLNRASNFKYMPMRFHPRGIDIDQGRHIANLMSITDALSQGLEQHSTKDNQRLLISRMQCHSCLIRLATILSPEECIYDTYTELFHQIVGDAISVMSQKQTETPEDKYGFSADFGLVQPLSYTATKCRNLDIRSAAIEMLDKCGTDGPFDAKVLAAISRRVVELETFQHDVAQSSTQALSYLVPERFRVCGCGPDLSQVREVGDPQVIAFFSRCVDVSVMMAERTPDGFEKGIHWQIWTENITKIG